MENKLVNSTLRFVPKGNKVIILIHTRTYKCSQEESLRHDHFVILIHLCIVMIKCIIYKEPSRVKGTDAYVKIIAYTTMYYQSY